MNEIAKTDDLEQELEDLLNVLAKNDIENELNDIQTYISKDK